MEDFDFLLNAPAKVAGAPKGATKQPKNSDEYDICDSNGKAQNGLRDNLRIILCAESCGMEKLERPIVVRSHKLSEILAKCTQEVCIAMSEKLGEKASAGRAAPFFRKAAGNDKGATKGAAKKSQKVDTFAGIDFSGLF